MKICIATRRIRAGWLCGHAGGGGAHCPGRTETGRRGTAQLGVVNSPEPGAAGPEGTSGDQG
ncbi:MAG: hypothetical protein ACK5F7_15620, partial [Planctomycetaceae bacterium]